MNLFTRVQENTTLCNFWQRDYELGHECLQSDFVQFFARDYEHDHECLQSDSYISDEYKEEFLSMDIKKGFNENFQNTM